ncbi:MAG: DUF362 domain-containing protein [SAR324 cluster bacterium]|nr:DUF362 domain-containing protein [SAR324 cluster bacterium]
MAKKKIYPHPDYQSEPMKRRDLFRKGVGVAAASTAAAYLAFAPEDFPFSLKDATGVRSFPQTVPFQLPDFRVEKAIGQFEIGLGRTGHAGSKLRKALDAIGGISHYVKPGDIVLIKPNVAFDRSPNMGATTNPQIINELVQLLLVDCRAAEVRVADNPIESPADCFAKSGIQEASERSGARVYLPDNNAFEVLNTPGATLIENWPFFKRPFKNVNKVIGVAPVKDHNLCHASLGVKNWYGLLGGRRNQFHQDIHEIVSDLSIMIRPTLSILDGTHVLMKNGPTGGDPSDVKDGDTIVAGIDPVAMDAWAFENLLNRKGELPQYLYKAQEKGSGSIKYQGRIREVT